MVHEEDSVVLDATPTGFIPAPALDSSGITDNRPGEPAAGLVQGTGDVRWLCQAVVEHLQAAHRRMLLQAGVADGRGSPYY